MNHDRYKALLTAYSDGELRGLRRFMVRRHAAACPSCLAELEAVQAGRLALKTSLTVHRAPPALAMRIGSALPREAAPVTRRAPPRWGFGGAALAGGIAGVALTLVLARPAPDPFVADLIADHVRSLMADHLMDVATSDQHTVKPWLSAHLELSPVVKDLTQEGFPLVGGRLDYLDGHRAAAVVYRRDKHIINLFAVAGSDGPDTRPVEESRDGFNIVRWRMGGLSYAAISDVEAPQLLTFVRLVSG
jgi:anti-sigma factor RsiW